MGPINVTIFEIVIILVIVVIYANLKKINFSLNSFENKILLLLAASLFFSCIHLFYVTNYVYDIKIILNLAENLALIYISLKIIRDVDFTNKVLNVFVAFALIVSMVYILLSLSITLPFFEAETRKTTYYLNPFVLGIEGTQFAAKLSVYGDIFLIALAFSLMRVIKLEILWWLFAAAFILAGIVTLSRSIILATITEIIFFLWMYNLVLQKKQFKIFVFFVFLVFSIVLLFQASDILNFLKELRPGTFDNRIEAFNSGTELSSSTITSFLLGVGKGKFSELNENIVIHNLFLDFFINGGLIASIFFIAFFYLLISNVARLVLSKKYSYNERLIGLAILCAMVGTLTHGIGTPILNSRAFWLAIAITVSFVSAVKNKKDLS